MISKQYGFSKTKYTNWQYLATKVIKGSVLAGIDKNDLRMK